MFHTISRVGVSYGTMVCALLPRELVGASGVPRKNGILKLK